MYRLTDPGSAYVQLLDDVAGNVRVQRWEIDSYLGFPGRAIGSSIDFRLTRAPRIDGRDSTVGDGVIGWQAAGERLDLGNATAGYVALPDAAFDEAYMARLETEEVFLPGAEMDVLSLPDAVVAGDVVLGDDRGDAAIETVDLSGGAFGGVRANDVARYDFIVDDDTYVHAVPDALVDALGYGRVTEREAAVVDALGRLGYDPADPVETDTVAWYAHDVQDAVDDRAALSSVLGWLNRKGFVEREGEGYALTRRGRQATRYR